jgi:hypothetical protein
MSDRADLMTDFAGASACYLGAIGDALGLFTELAGHGPASSSKLASRTGLDQRYLREWLAGAHAAGSTSAKPTTPTSCPTTTRGLLRLRAIHLDCRSRHEARITGSS